MKKTAPNLINQTVRELQLGTVYSPFHAAEGLEVRRKIQNSDTIICIGYILGPQITTIYRRIESKKGLFIRDKLWFLCGWLIKPRSYNNHYETLQEVPSNI